jgi:hypothetical protein
MRVADDMFGEMMDTSPESRAFYYARLKAMTPQERLAIASRLSASVRRLAVVGIKRDFPEYSERQVRRELCVRLYGADVAHRLFEGRFNTPFVNP